MSGHRPFNELTQDFTPERRSRIAGMKDELLGDMPLNATSIPNTERERRNDDYSQRPGARRTSDDGRE